MSRVLRNNGLSLAMFGFFTLFLAAQSVNGWQVDNAERAELGEPALTFGAYLQSGHFIEATFENWESEFLQMGAYVVLTVFLFQRGSSESKDPDAREEVDDDSHAARHQPDLPRPVWRGGLVLKLYEHSLSLVLLALFVFSFTMHAIGGTWAYNEEQLAQGGQTETVWQFLRSSEFWFQSFQNWQSEFLAVFSLVVLSIFLCQRGSPESKPVAAPHHQTGG